MYFICTFLPICIRQEKKNLKLFIRKKKSDSRTGEGNDLC